ncbi:hypothetical protein CEP52_010673 [Fusarium oligoseptatum]|uniref:Uncharacterized protein n=1 Tax=Fusarium oligoseptatum TaxID=2604345 RepID=A0A428T7B2_9HYPO|nr:hypothetical protein CEP52_010673 [Fusarium oligoseptatum]
MFVLLTAAAHTLATGQGSRGWPGRIVKENKHLMAREPIEVKRRTWAEMDTVLSCPILVVSVSAWIPLIRLWRCLVSAWAVAQRAMELWPTSTEFLPLDCLHNTTINTNTTDTFSKHRRGIIHLGPNPDSDRELLAPHTS